MNTLHNLVNNLDPRYKRTIDNTLIVVLSILSLIGLIVLFS